MSVIPGTVWLGGVVGVVFALVTPPFQVPDEPAHLYRAFALAEGRVLPEVRPGAIGAEIPCALADLDARLGQRLAFHPDARTSFGEIAEELKVELKPGERRFVDFRNTAVFSALPYVPQAAGIWVARRLTDRALPLLYAARLANLGVALLIVALALSRLPAGRLPAVLVALAPMSLQLMASASGDAYNLAVGWLTTALLVRLVVSEAEPPVHRDLVMACVALFLLGAGKLVYAPIGLLVLAIPRQRFGSTRVQRSFFAGAGLALAAGLACSLGAAARVNLPLRDGVGVDQARQGGEVLAHPARAMLAIGGDLLQHAPRYVAEALGHRLGWLDVPLPRLWVLAAFLVLVGGLAVREADEGVLPIRLRLLAAAAVALAAAAIVLSQLLMWTPVGADQVQGVQGRYFLPVAWLALLALASPRRRPAGAWAPRAILLSAALSLIVGLLALGRRYYG